MENKVEFTETETKILAAAKRVFVRKGMAGARMQEIADEAGINKALLHYYFRSKEKLFEAVFISAFSEMMPKLMQILSSELSFFDKIRLFFNNHVSFLQANPFLPVFILNELTQNPDRLIKTFQISKMLETSNFLRQIELEIAEGRIKPIDPIQLIINVLSLSIFPFAGGPMIRGVFNLSSDDFDALIERRKTEIPEFVINAILAK